MTAHPQENTGFTSPPPTHTQNTVMQTYRPEDVCCIEGKLALFFCVRMCVRFRLNPLEWTGSRTEP